MAQVKSQKSKPPEKSSTRRTVDGNDDGSHSLIGRSEPVQSRFLDRLIHSKMSATLLARYAQSEKEAKPGKCEWNAS